MLDDATRILSRFSLGLPLMAAVAGASGCSAGRPEEAEPPRDTARTTPQVSTEDASLTAEERLALAVPAGTTGADRAVTAAAAVARRNPRKDEAWVLLGRAWVQKARESADPGFYLYADAAARVVLARSPDDAPAQNLRGLTLLDAHRFEEARELAATLLARRPDDAMAWGTRSDACLELGRYEEAVTAAQTMMELKPNLPSYSRASHLQWLHGDVTAAKESVRLAIDAGRAGKGDAEPGAWVLVQAAMIFWSEGDHEGAEAGFDRALERVSDFAPAWVGKGRVAMARGDHRRAAELFERAHRTSPLVETAWLLGDAREAAGDATGARQAFAMVERDGRRSDPRTLSMYLSTKAEGPEALAEALRLARSEHATRKDVVTEDALAWAAYRAGALDEAKAAIVRARRLGTPDARMIFHEGAIRLAAARREGGVKQAAEIARARALVAEALRRNPAFDATGVKEARALVVPGTVTR